MADPTTVPTGIQPNLPAALSELGAALLLPALLIAVIAYFCGCFNGAVIVSKYILRDDVRTHGSGNAGLTNFYRTFGGPLTLVGIRPPHFVCFCNDARLFHFSYQRYLENQIRENFGFEGTPIRMLVREKGDKKQ